MSGGRDFNRIPVLYLAVFCFEIVKKSKFVRFEKVKKVTIFMCAYKNGWIE